MKLSEFLEAAWKKIEDPEHWTQNVYARNQKDSAVHCASDAASKFCAAGACRRVDYETSQYIWDKACILLTNAARHLYGYGDITSINDGHIESITDQHAAVKACYELAIEMAKEQEHAGQKPT